MNEFKREQFEKALWPWGTGLEVANTDHFRLPWQDVLYRVPSSTNWQSVLQPGWETTAEAVEAWWKAQPGCFPEHIKKEPLKWLKAVHSTWGLACKYLPDVKKPGDIELNWRVAFVLGVADPRTNLLTLAFRPQNGFASSSSGEAHAEDFLEDVFDRFLRRVQCFDSCLAQRPGLTLVLLGNKTSDACGLALRRAYHGALRRIGETAPDLDVRWVWEDDKPEQVLLSEILAGHPPGPPWPKATHQPVNDAMFAAVKSSIAKIRDIGKPIADPKNKISKEQIETITNMAGELANLNRPLGNLDVRASLAKQASHDVSSGTVMSLLEARLDIRQWNKSGGADGERELLVPLSPITIVSSENAAGKTSFTEGLAQVYVGRPRLRAVLPDRATLWGEQQPRIDVLRMATQPRAAVSGLLPLFPDDNDLRRGTRGELGLLTWWPLTGKEGSAWDGARDIATQLSTVLDILRNVRENLPEVDTSAIPDDAMIPPEFLGDLPGKLRNDAYEEWKKIDKKNTETLEERRTEHKEIEERREHAIKALEDRGVPSDSFKSTEAETIERPQEVTVKGAETEWQAFLDIHAQYVQSRRVFDPMEKALARDLEKKRKEIDAAWPGTNMVSSSKLDEILQGWRWEKDGLQSLDWSAIGNLCKTLGYRASTKRLLESALSKAAEDLEAAFASVSEKLAETIRPHERSWQDIDARLYDYVSVSVERHDPDKTRPNTARQVLHGLALRLSRWLVVGGVDCPILVLDEPTLGQDAAGGARSLERMLRLRRAVESHRWFVAANHRDASAEPILLKDSWTLGSSNDPVELKRRSVAEAWARGPISPQLIVSSFRLEVLGAAADLAGLVLSSSTRQNLKKLVPTSWHKDVVNALEEANRAWRREIASDNPRKAMPAQTLRLFWQAKDFPGEEKNDEFTRQKAAEWVKYVNDAIAQLEEFGLDGIAAEARRLLPADEPNFEDDKKDNDKKTPDVCKHAVVVRRELARRLLLWMMWTDLLPAAFGSAEDFHISGVSFREFPAVGGLAESVGPFRLRRLGAYEQWLPPDPTDESKWNMKSGPGASKGEAPNLPAMPPTEPESSAIGAATASAEPETPPVPAQPPAASPLADPPAERVVPVVPAEPRRAGGDVTEPAAEPPPIEASSSVWRVYAPADDRAAHWEDIIRGAGMLPSSGNEPVQKRIDSTWLEAHAYDERGAIDVPRASRVLLDERLRQVTPPASLEDVEPLKIAIATHIRDQIPHPQTALLYGALEPFGTRIDEDGQRILLTSWEARIAQPLTSARDALAARALHDVCFHPKCHPGVAIRAGAIFHFRTGFSVGCEQNGNIWDVDEQVVKAEGPFLTPERTSAPRSNAAESEIHLLVSVSQDVKNGYDKWREETTGRFSEWVHFKPKKGTGRDALDERSVVDGALQVAEAILAIAPPRCVRIFCAGPVAFALALGRTMNTWGNIVTMDYSKMAGTYFESFRFRA